MGEWDALVASSNQVSSQLPAVYQPAYFQLVHHPIIAGRNTQALYIDAGYNQLYASQARSQTNQKADVVEANFEYDEDIRDKYHGLLDGKWNHMMSQTHLGCRRFLLDTALRSHALDYYWQQPMLNSMPSITRVQKRQTALPGPMRITVEDSKGAWPGDNSNQCAQGYNCPVCESSALRIAILTHLFSHRVFRRSRLTHQSRIATSKYLPEVRLRTPGPPHPTSAGSRSTKHLAAFPTHTLVNACSSPSTGTPSQRELPRRESSISNQTKANL